MNPKVCTVHIRLTIHDALRTSQYQYIGIVYDVTNQFLEAEAWIESHYTFLVGEVNEVESESKISFTSNSPGFHHPKPKILMRPSEPSERNSK